MLIHSFCLCWGVRGSCCILVNRNLTAAILCSYGWLDVKWINVSTVVGILYILNFNVSISYVNKEVQTVYGSIFFLCLVKC
jgi:hypothetical protein